MIKFNCECCQAIITLEDPKTELALAAEQHEERMATDAEYAANSAKGVGFVCNECFERLVSSRHH